MNAASTSSTPACCLLTAPGRGAVAVIAVRGTDVDVSLDRFFQSASGFRIAEKKSRNIFYGHWLPTGEDILITRATADRFEIHCHGGNAAPASILETLTGAGFPKISNTEMATRVHGSVWKSETAIALSQALTEKTASLLLRQYQIADETWTRWNESVATNRETVIAEMEQSLTWAEWGIDLTRPRSVVFCGQPNVGKSSLVNALLGFGRSIVDAAAGTTRDVVSHVSAIGGWPVELKDTAGLREAAGEIETIGIGLARKEIRDADLVIAVFDASDTANESAREASALTHSFLKQLTNEWGRQPDVLVRNKIDLVSVLESPATNLTNGNNDSQIAIIDTSVVTGHGIPALLTAIETALVPSFPPPGLLIPVTTAQRFELRDRLM
jgi:tRNA modification GTPase